MAWFEGVAEDIQVTERGLVLADEAIFLRELQSYGPEVMESPSYAERVSPDWGATKVLFMARVQLDQMIDLLGRVVGQDVFEWDADRVRTALDERVRKMPALDREEWELEIARLSDGVQLRHALGGDLGISHAYAVDGSIALTAGPPIPKMNRLGLRGSESGEMEDEPDRIFDLAVDLTTAATLLLDAVTAAESRA